MKNVTICFTLIGAKESHEMVASRHIDCRVNWGPTMDQGGKILHTPNFFLEFIFSLNYTRKSKGQLELCYISNSMYS